MAEEEIENLPPKEEGAPAAEGEKKEGGEKPKSSGGGIMQFVPLVVIVILVPVLSFLTTKMVLIPKIEHALVATVEEAKKMANPEANKEEHTQHTYEFKDIVANLSGALQSRYLKVSFTMMGTDPEFVEIIEKNKPALLDATISVISKNTVMDIEQPGSKVTMKNDLLAAYEQVLNKEIIQRIDFTEFVSQ